MMMLWVLMMTLQKQIEHINNSLFAAKMANLIQYMYEDELKQAVAAIFKHMREEITANLEEFYGDVLFNAHMDLILAPIHENHKAYYDTIMKYKLREHRKGRTQGKRLVERAQKYAIQYSKNIGAIKADDKIPLSSLVQKDKLFATSDFSAEQMRDKTFVASENTLARVDKDINTIITDGYREGLGINDVTNRVNTRFNQLESWEAQRIARTEIHGSHMMGVMNSYEDMGVEYLQWAAAHDNRTRDTHAKLDGEIISMGGIFSNGCRFPGDTNAPLSEVINCRCGVLPWFCPPGMMVPVGMSNFRESDLIVTLDKWSNEQLLTQFREEVSPIPKQSSSFDLDIVNPKLIDSKFSIPNEDLSEFGITEKGMETIQRYTKRRIGSDIEYGVVFNEKNGKFLSKEFKGASNDIVLTKPNGKYSTIHYHTDEGFRPTSSGDFFEFLNSKNERVGINISRKESWFIKNEGKLTSKEINKITVDIDRLEQKQLKKLTDEYRKSSLKINKIKDPVKRQSAQKEFEKYVANEFLDKHNKELGDAILEYTSNIKGLKVKRVMHTEINPKSIKTISKKELKVDKRSFKELTGVKRQSTPIKNNELNLSDSEIKQRLSEMSEREKLKELKQTLDKGQTRSYSKLMSKLKHTDPSSKEYKEIQAKMWEYDKLLFKPKNPTPNIDVTKFKMDEQVGEVHTIKNTILEKKQIDIQNKINLTMAEESDLHAYGGKPHTYINGFLKKNDDWDKFVLDMSSKGYSEQELIKGTKSLRGMEDIISNMDSAMVKSSGLTQDTVIFSGTEFDGTLRAGDFSSFAEYRSCSYQYDSAESFKIGKPERYMVKIYAPEGQKGIAMNAKMSDGNRLGFYSHEHEFLLPRGQEFQVIEVDHFNKEATILLI